jgi:hypothetical protein
MHSGQSEDLRPKNAFLEAERPSCALPVTCPICREPYQHTRDWQTGCPKPACRKRRWLALRDAREAGRKRRGLRPACHRLLAKMRSHGSITTHDAIQLAGGGYGSRISEIRQWYDVYTTRLSAGSYRYTLGGQK